MLQSFRLICHRLAVLFDELRKDKFQQRRSKRHPAKNIPASHDVDAALVARDWRNRGKAGEPVLSRANGFEAQVRQNEINGGGD